MNRGEVYWVELPSRTPEGKEINKTRPGVVISVLALNKARSTVLIVPLSSNNKVYPPISISVPTVGDKSVAVCDQLLAVDKSRIKKQIATLTSAEIEEIDNSLRLILGL